MALFNYLKGTFCSGSCATLAGSVSPPGAGIRFDRAYLDSEEDSVYYKNVTVNSSQGDIFLKLRYGKPYGSPHRKIPDAEPTNWKVPEKIEHYSILELKNSKDLSQLAPVCIGLFVDHTDLYKESAKNTTNENDRRMYQGYVDQYTAQRKFLESLNDILLFKSEPFHNSIHANRKNPLCVLYIFDKEMKK